MFVTNDVLDSIRPCTPFMWSCLPSKRVRAVEIAQSDLEIYQKKSDVESVMVERDVRGCWGKTPREH